MTAVADAPIVEVEAEEKVDGRKNRERDFSKYTKMHESLAAYVNENDKFQEAGLDPVTPSQVKAILTLRTEYADTPERRAEREARKAERAAEKEKYAGLTDEEIKAEKAARRAEKQAAKLEARVQEALAKAKALREGKDASGADLVAAVEAQQGEDNSKPKRRIGRNR